MPILPNGYVQWVEQAISEIISDSPNRHYAEANLVPYIAMGRVNLRKYDPGTQDKVRQELRQIQALCVQRIAESGTSDKFYWECKQLLIDGILSEEDLPHF